MRPAIDSKSSASCASPPTTLSTSGTKGGSSLTNKHTPPNQLSSRDSDVSSSKSTTDKSVQLAEKKKLPPIKAPVGLVKGPDLKNCKSKVGSLNNIKHTPTGGTVTIASQKLKWNATSKVGSLENKEHKPGGGKLKVESQKLEWKTTSKVQSLQNVKHKPGGGNVKIFNDPTYADKKELSKPTSAATKTTTDNVGDSGKEIDARPTTTTSNNHNKSTKEKLTERDTLTERVKGLKI